MAFMATGASAAFLYTEGTTVKTLTVASEPVIEAHTDGTLRIPAKNLKILCQKVESDPGAKVILLPNSTVAHGHLLFKECESFDIKTNTLQKNCTPKSPGQELGKILAGGLAELILHPANNTMVLFKPLVVEGVTQPFTTIVLPELCALAETSNVTGSLVAECGQLKSETEKVFVGGNCATHRVTQLLQSVSEALAKTLGDTLKFGASEAFVDGIAAVKFAAPCAGCAWGGDAA
jgi:hypothetical protein